jgi:hypothetical protein
LVSLVKVLLPNFSNILFLPDLFIFLFLKLTKASNQNYVIF